MDAKGITLEELAGALGYEVRTKNKHKYIRMAYTGYFRYGTYHNIIVRKEEGKFKVHVHVNIPKASAQEMVIEQNGVKIVIEELINQTIKKIMSRKEYINNHI